MHRSTNHILTTHPGRLPNPDNQDAILQARGQGDQQTFDALVRDGIVAMVRRQREIGLDILSDGEFWKARDQRYYDSRATGVEVRPTTPEQPATLVSFQRERRMPEFRAFWEIYEQVGNTPMPGTTTVTFLRAPQRAVITGPLTSRPPDAILHEIEVVKAGIAAAGASVEDFFFPVLGPGWLGHWLWNEYYKTDEEYVYAMAAFFKNDYRAVVDAGFVLQIDDPGLCDRWGMVDPPISLEEYRKQAALRIEATNWALEGIPEDRVRYHTCWGSWHTPHVTDLPFEHVIDLMLRVKAGAYSVEAADVRHELDWKLWETRTLPDGKVYIPGVIAHKTTTIEPPELVAERIIRYANLMGRENIIAGVDCGVGGRCYPDIGWAKLKALVEGAALASKRLWGLKRVDGETDIAFLAAEGSPEQFIYRIRKAPEKRLDLVAFGAATPEDVDALAEELARDGVRFASEPGRLQTPAGGYGFRFFDPDGWTVEVSAGVAERPYREIQPREAIPVAINHVVLSSPNRRVSEAFYQEKLGFKLSDWIGFMGFFRCNANHHSLAFFDSDVPTLNHVAFEVPGIDEMMRGAGRVIKDGRARVMMGPGRHSAGDNTFYYFFDPQGNVSEYTAEVEQILDEDAWVPREHFTGDVWGVAARPGQPADGSAGASGPPQMTRPPTPADVPPTRVRQADPGVWIAPPV